MGFSGGGSNVLKPHKHSSAVQDGSPLNMNNVTEATLTAGDIVYSDGSALQRLPIGSTAEALVVSGGSPTWGAATSNPLIKVSKTFADIAASEMDIYTLPVNAALTNVYTDITTPFDVSTAPTIGDAGDDNGFLEATNWTSGAGLTSATRGAYVTSFKTMRSTSGTTAIKAYNFTSTTTPPSFDAQAQTSSAVVGGTLTNSGFTVAANSNRILIVAAGRQGGSGDITGVTWNGAENFTRAVFLQDGTGTRTEMWYLVNPTATTADIVTTWGGTANRRGAGVYSYYNAKQTSPIGVTNTAFGTSVSTTGTITPTTTGSLIVDVEISESSAAGTDTLTAGWTVLVGGATKSFGSQYDLTPTINSSNNMFYTYVGSTYWSWCGIEVKTASSPVSDTQGEVDFYLQVVD
jgi:hypothetical protein